MPVDMTHAEAIVCPPTACPTQYATEVGRWDKEPLDLFKKCRVPWSIVAALSHPTMATLADFSERFDSADDVRATAGTELGFTAGAVVGSWTTPEVRVATAHLKDCWKQAEATCKHRNDMSARAAEDDVTRTMVPGHRQSMERAYESKYGEKAPLEDQGSDTLLGLLWKDANNGGLGTYNTAQITAHVPEPHVLMQKVVKQRKSVDGTVKEHEHQERASPENWEQWKHQELVWRTSVLMAVASNPHHTNLQITKKELDNFYNWLYGPDVAGRSPPPPLRVMMYATRMAWARITILLHKGVTLSEALKTLSERSDLFWQKEVADKCKGPGLTGQPWVQGQGKGWRGNGNDGQGGATAWSRKRLRNISATRGWNNQQASGAYGGNNNWGGGGHNQGSANPPHTSKGGKGGKTGKNAKGGKGGKGGNKGGGKPAAWASTNDKGVRYCWGWNGGNCSNPNCNSIHRCCVQVGKWQNGCNKNHMAIQH